MHELMSRPMFKKPRTITLNICLALLWEYSAYLNVQSFLVYHNPAVLLFILFQTEFAFLMIIRKDTVISSKNPLDYAVAIAGTFIVFLYRPVIPVEGGALLGSTLDGVNVVHLIGNTLIYISAIWEIFGFVSLNRSAGIIPANRGIKTGGLYKIVRHPIYLGSMILYIGYSLLNPSFYNMCILFIAVCLQIARIYREEKVLIHDAKYREYTHKVKWRLIPGFF